MTALLVGAPGADLALLESNARDRIDSWLSPLTGGDGLGWSFGGTVRWDALVRVLLADVPHLHAVSRLSFRAGNRRFPCAPTSCSHPTSWSGRADTSSSRDGGRRGDRDRSDLPPARRAHRMGSAAGRRPRRRDDRRRRPDARRTPRWEHHSRGSPARPVGLGLQRMLMVGRRTVRRAPARAVRRRVRRVGHRPTGPRARRGRRCRRHTARARHGRRDPQRANGTPCRRGAVAGAVGVAITGDGVVVVSRGGQLTFLDRSGLVCRVVDTCLPADRALPRTRVPGLRSGPSGFCLPHRGCFDWLGQAVASIADEPPIHLAASGTYRSVALDSGLAGCEWHRVRIDADVPPETEVRVEVATTDGSPKGHEPHPTDWFEVGAGVLDTMLRTPPGRWAFVRVELRGDGRRSPTLHRIRLDLPRHSGLDDLPAIYAEDPRARDFTERFLGVFDVWLEQVDDTIARRGAAPRRRRAARTMRSDGLRR